MYYKDDFYKEFRTEKELCECLEEIDSRAEWIRGTSTGDEPCSAYEIYCGICESITIARQEKTNERGLLALEEKIAGCVSKRWHEYDIPGTVKY